MSSNWIDRIKSSEINPPPAVWGKIDIALDESLDNAAFPARLYDAAVNPPVSVWNNIEATLDDAAPVIPLQKKTAAPVIFRYLVAACLIGLIAFGAIRLFTTGTHTDNSVAGADTETPSNTNTATPVEPQQQLPVEVQTQAQKDDAALEESKQTYARLDLTRRSSSPNKLYKAPAPLASFASESMSKEPEIQYSHRAAVSDSRVEAADRYALYQNADGKVVRVSKKLSELFCCISGEVQDEKCNSQLKQWREKIASSPFNPSPDNFMDILDLINSIQDTRN